MTGKEADAFRLVLRAASGGLNYSSTAFDRTGLGAWRDQTSWMGRGSLLLGGLLRPDSSFSAYLTLGGGIQLEWYDETLVTGSAATIDDTQDPSFVGSGRLDVHWEFAAETVSFRIRSAATYFQLTRTNDFIGTEARVQSTTTTSFHQLEVSTRGFFDIDAAAFYGFRPSVHGGLDFVRVSGVGSVASTTIPVFGAGLNHPWL